MVIFFLSFSLWRSCYRIKVGRVRVRVRVSRLTGSGLADLAIMVEGEGIGYASHG